MFSEASVLGLIHCVVVYKGVLTLLFGYRLVWNCCDILSTSVKVDLRVLTVQKNRNIEDVYIISTKTLCSMPTVKGGKVLFLKIIFKILFLIDLPKSAGGTFFFFTYSLVTLKFGTSWWSERDKAAFNNINHLNHIMLYIYTYTSGGNVPPHDKHMNFGACGGPCV